MPVVPPSTQPVEPWITAADLTKCATVTACVGCDPNTTPAPAVLAWTPEELVQAATDLLFKASGYRFPGIRTETIMPRYDACGCAGACHHYPLIETDQQWPIVAVTEVRIDGAIVDPATYAVDDWSRLVRLADPITGANPGWPTGLRHDRPSSVAADTMTVTYTYGRPAPMMGKIACLALACGMRSWTTAKIANTFGANVVPGRAATKKDASQAFLEGQTGIVEVDRFLAPEPHGYGMKKPAFVGVWSPGLEAADPVRRSWP